MGLATVSSTYLQVSPVPSFIHDLGHRTGAVKLSNGKEHRRFAKKLRSIALAGS
jgi:hypothetical protein